VYSQVLNQGHAELRGGTGTASPGVLWRLRSDPPRKLSYFVKHFVGSYSITGVLIMLLGAVAEKEIYTPSSAVIAESGTEANTHFLDHTFSPRMTLLWKLRHSAITHGAGQCSSSVNPSVSPSLNINLHDRHESVTPSLQRSLCAVEKVIGKRTADSKLYR